MSNVLTFPSRDDGHSPLFFSADVPAALSERLKKTDTLGDEAVAEAALLGALTEWPEALDAHIALYKFYFRCGRYAEAERAIWGTLREAARQSGFRWNYRLLAPNSADWEDHGAPSRLYLFSLKALGVVRLRRGEVPAARRVLTKLMELDPHDGIGGGSFLSIARQFEDIGDEEE